MLCQTHLTNKRDKGKNVTFSSMLFLRFQDQSEDVEEHVTILSSESQDRKEVSCSIVHKCMAQKATKLSSSWALAVGA
jgi:hypothetical protein